VAAENVVDAITIIGPRRAGSEAERRTARLIQQRLEELGREAELEPTRVRPNLAIPHLIHAVLGIVASVLSVYVPAAGVALGAVATLSTFGELTGAFLMARALTPARASQNVVSDEDNDKPGLIVLVAHYDAPLEGMLQSRRFAPWPRVLLGSLVVITVCAIARLVGLEATWLTLIQFIPTVILIASTPLFADAALSTVEKGETDNAAGVSAVLQHANTQLTHFDLLLLFTGASADSGLGMRAWLKQHRKELDPEATAVIAIDRIGDGDAAYAIKEGPVFASRMHPTLAEIASEAGGESYESNESSDAYVARSLGLPALRVSTTGVASEPDPDAVAGVQEFVGRLLKRIDQEIGPRLA
jgi:hypothetical protein